jgi:hypothetical protein
MSPSKTTLNPATIPELSSFAELCNNKTISLNFLSKIIRFLIFLAYAYI